MPTAWPSAPRRACNDVGEHVKTSDTPLDKLVNNAGTMQYFDLTVGDALARLEAELALNLHAPIHLAMALLPVLLARPKAALVNITTGLVYAPFAPPPATAPPRAGFTPSRDRSAGRCGRAA